MANTGYREKKEGPVRLIYQGERHIGNIIDPVFGAANSKTQGYTAISKHWGRKTTHDSKHAAMTWLTGRHGATMRIENTGDNGSTFDVLRDNGWKKTHPYGFKHHLADSQGATYVHPDLPSHHITASYTNGTWRHHIGNTSTVHAHGMSAGSLHNHLTKVHSSKTIEGIKEYVQWAQEEFPENWQEVVIELLHRPLQEEPVLEEPILGATPHSTMQRAVKASKVSVVKRDPTKAVTLPPSENTIGEGAKPPSGAVRVNKGKSKVRTRLLDKEIKQALQDLKDSRIKKEDNNSGDGQSGGISNSDMPHDRDIIDKDPKNQKNKGKVPGKKSKGLDTVMKYANKANIRNADDSIPKVDTKPAFNTGKDNTGTDSTGEKQGPHPVPSSDAEGELTIKRTMTGEPGDTIEINPLMKRTGAYGGTNYNPSPEGKKTPNT